MIELDGADTEVPLAEAADAMRIPRVRCTGLFARAVSLRNGDHVRARGTFVREQVATGYRGATDEVLRGRPGAPVRFAVLVD